MTAPGRTVAGRSARGSRVLEDVVPLDVAVLESVMDRRVSIHDRVDTKLMRVDSGLLGGGEGRARRPSSGAPIRWLRYGITSRGHVDAERAPEASPPSVEGEEAVLLGLRRPPRRRRRPRSWRCDRGTGCGGDPGRSRRTAPASRPRRPRRRPRPAGCGRRSAPCSAAFVQCSMRISSPNSALGQRATSPAAYTPGAPAASVASQTMPSRSSRPLPSSHAVAGATPMPTTMASAGTIEPSARSTPSVGQLGHGDVAADVDALGDERGRGGRPHRRPEAADQRRRRALQHGDRAAPGPGRGRHLEADEAGPDDDDPRRAVGDDGTQGQGVVERAQLVDRRHQLLARAAAGCPSRWR